MKFFLGVLVGMLLVAIPVQAQFLGKNITLEPRQLDLLMNQVLDRLNKMTDIAAYTITNVNTDRTFDADSTTLGEVADVLGTLIETDLTGGRVLK